MTWSRTTYIIALPKSKQRDPEWQAVGESVVRRAWSALSPEVVGGWMTLSQAV
jgi:hypothetical protein